MGTESACTENKARCAKGVSSSPDLAWIHKTPLTYNGIHCKLRWRRWLGKKYIKITYVKDPSDTTSHTTSSLKDTWMEWNVENEF